MITVENLLMAFENAYDAWLDPDAERENPVPEYAAMIRRAVGAENAELLDLVCDMWAMVNAEYPRGGFPDMGKFERRMRELGIEVDE